MITERRPGFGAARLARLAGEAVDAMELDLRDRVIFTEAATGAYAVTPILAALAGARKVIAVTRATRYGSVGEVIAATRAVAARADVWDRIMITTERRPADVAEADVVTNSGHVRPIDAEFVTWMKPDAVVPLMFEAWEVQAGRFDVDLHALHMRGIVAAGTRERHPSVGVFEHLGPMAIASLNECGVAVHGARAVLLCDNPFEPYLVDGLRRGGATVWSSESIEDVSDPGFPPDVILVAKRPTGRPVLNGAAVAARWGTNPIIVQYWGDIDRMALADAGLSYWPPEPPPAGHMAVLPSAVGPEPIVRLQAGGLKVAQVLLTSPGERTAADLEYVDAL